MDDREPSRSANASLHVGSFLSMMQDRHRDRVVLTSSPRWMRPSCAHLAAARAPSPGPLVRRCGTRRSPSARSSRRPGTRLARRSPRHGPEACRPLAPSPPGRGSTGQGRQAIPHAQVRGSFQPPLGTESADGNGVIPDRLRNSLLDEAIPHAWVCFSTDRWPPTAGWCAPRPPP
jgi:hypothetical protein